MRENRALISTFLMIETTQRAAQKFITLVELSRMVGAVISNTFTT